MINFTGKVTVDKKLKPPKNSNFEEIVHTTKQFVEHPLIGDMFDDVVFTNLNQKGSKKGFMMKYGEIDIPFVTNWKVSAGMVIEQLLVCLCYKNNIPWYMEYSKGRWEFFKQLVDEYLKAKSDN